MGNVPEKGGQKGKEGRRGEGKGGKEGREEGRGKKDGGRGEKGV